MNANIINASRGKTKEGKPWLRLSYTVGSFGEEAGRVGLRLANSFVPEEHQQAVWETLSAAVSFPAAADLQISTSNGRSVEVVAVELTP